MKQKLKFLIERNPKMKQIVLVIYKNTIGRYEYKRENKLFLKNANIVLDKVDKVFQEIGVTYWLDFGTLLGLYRDGKFLEHDLDLDFGAFLHEYSTNIESTFVKYGFKKIRTFEIDGGNYGREETYEYMGVPIDIFYYTKLNAKKAYYHDFRPIEGLSRDLTIKKIGGLVPRELSLSLKNIGNIEYNGKTYPIPEPVEEHLSDRYGKDFMIPNNRWNTDKEINSNIKILKDKIGVRHIYK